MFKEKICKSVALVVSLLSVLMLSACGSGGGGDDSENVESAPQGYFLDSLVHGLEYSSPSFSGRTEVAGNFEYQAGETTTFSFQGLVIGSVLMSDSRPSITPLDIFNTSNVDDQRVKNLLVLLQTLDNDQIPSNGISLSYYDIPGEPEQTYLSALDLSSASFQADLQPVLDNKYGADTITVVNETLALNHFDETLALMNGTPDFASQTWIMRSQKYGDVSAEYIFNVDGTLSVTEYDACPATFWAATKDSAIANCLEKNQLSLAWTFNAAEKKLIMSNDEITDTCYVQIATSEYIRAVCNFFGSGLGTELITFENMTAIRATDLVTGLKPTGAFAVFDGDSGECKHYYNFSQTSDLYVTVQESTGSQYICTHSGLISPSGFVVNAEVTESGSVYDIYEFSITGSPDDKVYFLGLSKTCDPLYQLNFSGTKAIFASCNNGGADYYEIWKSF
jgi:hypothetical protein